MLILIIKRAQQPSRLKATMFLNISLVTVSDVSKKSTFLIHHLISINPFLAALATLVQILCPSAHNVRELVGFCDYGHNLTTNIMWQ